MNVENLQFYLRYMAHMELEDPKLRKISAKTIYFTFLKVGSEMEINVSDAMRKYYKKIFEG